LEAACRRLLVIMGIRRIRVVVGRKEVKVGMVGMAATVGMVAMVGTAGTVGMAGMAGILAMVEILATVVPDLEEWSRLMLARWCRLRLRQSVGSRILFFPEALSLVLVGL